MINGIRSTDYCDPGSIDNILFYIIFSVFYFFKETHSRFHIRIAQLLKYFVRDLLNAKTTAKLSEIRRKHRGETHAVVENQYIL